VTDQFPGPFLKRDCLDSPELAEQCRRALDIPRIEAIRLGMKAMEVVEAGYYTNEDGAPVDIRAMVQHAIAAKRSIPPDAPLPEPSPLRTYRTTVQVANETTFGAVLGLVPPGERALALNFANGIHPGGGFLGGSRAQEEVLCRSSALWHTLEGDPMYAAHRQRALPDSTAWAILSPHVPVFWWDNGWPRPTADRADFLTCAAPVASWIGHDMAAQLMHERIHRVLAIARAYEYEDLVLGAWGCGAFGNDPLTTARSFRAALEGPFRNAFRHIFFAIADWSPERKFLGPFRDVFAE
jgi:uncharacterized protein (TIGR02452 family)